MGGRPWKVTLFHEFYERKYVANGCSWGNLFVLFTLAVTIVLPFLLTFSTGSKYNNASTVL